jgi:hypothetical protein
VTEVDYGFHFYVPGKLLRIALGEVLKGNALLDSYYIFFPVAEFSAGPYRICKTDSRYPKAPDIGDELLIMVPGTRTRSSTDPFLELEEASSVVVIPKVGAPDLPAVFKESDAEKSAADKESAAAFKSRAELVAAVRRALSKKEEMP